MGIKDSVNASENPQIAVEIFNSPLAVVVVGNTHLALSAPRRELGNSHAPEGQG